MVVTTLFQSLYGKESNPIITGFHKSSIVVYTHDGILELIFGLQPNINTSELTFTKRVNLRIKPPLPQNFECKKILVSSNKHHIALVGINDVLLVTLQYDLVCFAAKTSAMKDEYYCESVSLISSRHSKKIKVREVRWSNDLETFSGSLLGILLSSNIVELFNCDKPKNPMGVADFSVLLPRSSNTFGLGVTAENFTFGHKVINDLEPDDIYHSIIVIDTDGHFHSVCFKITETNISNILPAISSIPIYGLKKTNILEDVSDILLLNNSCSNKIPIFAITTYTGLVIHLTSLVKSAVEWRQSNPQLEFYVVENYRLPVAKSSPKNPITISNDENTANHYIIQDSCAVYSVNYSTSLNNLISKISESNLYDETESLKFHHILKTSGCLLSYTSSAICLDDSNLKKVPLQAIMFVCVCEDSNLLYHCINRELCKKSHVPEKISLKKSMESQKETQSTLVADILKILSNRRVFPAFKMPEKYNEKLQLECIIAALQVILANNDVLDCGIEKVSSCLENLSKIQKENSEYAAKELNRFSTYFDDLMLIKNQVKIHRDSIKKLIQRTDKVTEYVVPSDDVPLIEDEIKIYEKLESMEESLNSLNRATIDILENINDKKDAVYGNTKSFQSSASTQKFMLMKNTKDIESLVKWTKKLHESVDELL
uniref:CNH domain-containing protein n=1 Tax=Parastrongyloides trichosuri TaxID=131310 RepID=A0A0N4ZX85_PARTI